MAPITRVPRVVTTLADLPEVSPDELAPLLDLDPGLARQLAIELVCPDDPRTSSGGMTVGSWFERYGDLNGGVSSGVIRLFLRRLGRQWVVEPEPVDAAHLRERLGWPKGR